MADIRINALATTAASTASDDFIAVDGSANGTRKLNAYSPTFGGNLTVSGTGTSTFSGNLNLNGTDKSILLNGASTQFSREIDVRIAGDTEGRLLIRGGGSLLWGDGAGGFDSTLARTAANMLTITGGLTTSGNLTVSGTGTSSVAGNLGVGTTTPNKLLEAAKNLATNTVGAGEVLRLISDDGNNVGRVTEIGFGVGPTGATYAPVTLGTVVTTATGFNKKDFYIATRDATTDSAPSERLRLFANGNLFVGASPVDSSNGKLQLATHTTSAGGIGFGTDVSFYRKSAALMGLNGSGGAKIDFHEGGTLKGGVGTYAGSMYVVSDTTSPILFYTNASLALTLDSSQNATFAGIITTQSSGTGSGLVIKRNANPYVDFYDGGTSGTIRAEILADNDGVSGGNFKIQTRNNAGTMTLAATFDKAQNATFAGTELNLNPNSGNAFIYSRVTGGGIGGIVIADSQASGRTYGIESGRTAGSFAIRDYTAAANRLTIDSAGAATFGSSITTSAPTGGAGAWELGVANTVSPTAPNRTITIEIGGTVYYLHAKTTND